MSPAQLWFVASQPEGDLNLPNACSSVETQGLIVALHGVHFISYKGFFLGAGCCFDICSASKCWCQVVVVCTHTHTDCSVLARQGYIFTVFKSQLRTSFLSVGREQIQGFVCKLAMYIEKYYIYILLPWQTICPLVVGAIQFLYIMYKTQSSGIWMHEFKKREKVHTE